MSRPIRELILHGRSDRGALTPILLVAVLLVAGCEGDATPSAAGDRQPEAAARNAARITPAVYSTTLAFVGFGGQPPNLYLRLDNLATAETLELEYSGWLDSGAGWTTVLDVRESAAIPRAAWRVLPVGPLRVKVAEGEELASLFLDDMSERLELVIGETLQEWASSTGQRESLKRAALVTGGAQYEGVLLSSQTASLVGSSSGGTEHAVLLSDSVGNALVVLRSTAEPATPVVVHTLLDGTSRRWDGAELVPEEVAQRDGTEADGGPGDGAGGPSDAAGGRWTLVIPGAAIEAEIRVATAVEIRVATAGESDSVETRVAGPRPASASVHLPDGTTLSLSGFQAALTAR